MGRFCTIRPANDVAALELSMWCSALHPVIGTSGHELTKDIYASSAVRSTFSGAVGNADCVLFFGHGSETELLGERNVAFVDGMNISLAAGKVFIAVACSSARVLGPVAIQNSVKSYLGFNGLLVWIHGDPNNQFQPATTIGIRRLLLGGTTGDARLKMFEAFGNAVDFYLNGTGRGTANSAIGWLAAYWDQQHLVLLGYTKAAL